jgi:hypothetical protein
MKRRRSWARRPFSHRSTGKKQARNFLARGCVTRTIRRPLGRGAGLRASGEADRQRGRSRPRPLSCGTSPWRRRSPSAPRPGLLRPGGDHVGGVTRTVRSAVVRSGDVIALYAGPDGAAGATESPSAARVFGSAHTHDRPVRDPAVGAEAAVVFSRVRPLARDPPSRGHRAELHGGARRPATSCAATACSGSGTRTRPTRPSAPRSPRPRCAPSPSSSAACPRPWSSPARPTPTPPVRPPDVKVVTHDLFVDRSGGRRPAGRSHNRLTRPGVRNPGRPWRRTGARAGLQGWTARRR